MKVIIAGGRDFTDYDLLLKKCDFKLQNQDDIEVVCGMARGADLLGKRYAEERGYKIAEFPADWDNLGKKAGLVRNTQMGEYADALIAFWDGRSRGTKHMIEEAIRLGLKYKVYEY